MKNPARGWIGTLAFPKEDAPPVGAVFTVDYPKLLHYYICMTPSMLEYPTVEWYYQPARLKDGDSFRTAVKLMPCRGLREISGAGEGIVGELRLSPAQPEVGQTLTAEAFLVSDRTRKVSVEFADELLAWDATKSQQTNLGSKSLSLSVDEMTSSATSVPIKVPGTHVVSARVLDEKGGPLAALEKPLVVKSPSGQYALKPLVPRIVEDSSVKRRPNLSGPLTEHIPWATPLRSGPIRALLIIDVELSRQIVELAQRLDMQCDDVLHRDGNLLSKDSFALWGQRGSAVRQHYEVEEHEDEAERLRRLLLHNRYDALVIDADGCRLRNAPEDVQKLVVDRVRDGMGVVLAGVSPHNPGTHWLDALSPLIVGPGASIPHHIHFTDEKSARDGMIRTISHQLFRGQGMPDVVPFRLFPPTAIYAENRLVKCEGDTALEYDGNPILVQGTAGAGRVAVINAATHGVELNTYFEDQTPAMWGERYQEYPYHEYSYLLLSKLIQWAAKRESEVRLLRINTPKVTGDEVALAVDVRNSLKTESRLTVEATLRNPFHEVVEWPGGVTTESFAADSLRAVSLTARGPLASGSYAADVILRDAAGKVVDYGSAAFEVPGSAKIVLAKPRVPLQQRGSRAEVVVDVESESPRSASLRWRLVDTYDRILQEGNLAANLDRGRTAAKVATSAIETDCSLLRLDLTLEADGHPLHRHKSYLFVRQSPRVDDLMLEVYGLGGGAKANRSFPFMRQLGVDGGGVNFSGNPWNAAFFSLRNNIRPMYGYDFIYGYGYFGEPKAVRGGSPRSWGDVLPDDPPNVRVWPGISRPGSGSYPICPHDPACIERRLQLVKDRAPIATLYSPMDYYIGDEATFQRDVYVKTEKSVDDQCFCKYCLAAFRQYLKKQYGTLESLNSSWDTSVGSWDQVMALPGRQARLLANWSRWIDFRIFTAKSFCGSVAQVQEKLREFDPGARTSGNIHWESPWTAYMAYYLHGPRSNATAELYPRTFEQVRSYAPDAAFRRLHIGYPNYAGHPRTVTDHFSWRQLGYGGGRIDFYNGIEGLHGGVLSPTYETDVSGQWLQSLDEKMRKTGIAKAILSSQPEPAQVGVMESYPSQFSYYLEPQHFDEEGYYKRGDYTMWHDVKQVWGSYGSLAEDVGLSWRLLNEEECAESVPDGFRGVVVPRATCLAAKTARALEQFVRNGGIVIADVRLAERDEHGRPSPGGSPEWMESLFGIRRSTASCDESTTELEVDKSQMIRDAIKLSTTCHDRQLTVTKGQSHGKYSDGSAHTIVHPLGKGFAAYPNCELWGYGSTRSPAARDLFRGLLSLRRVAPDAVLLGEDNQPVPNTLFLKRSRGNISYYFILRNMYGPATEAATLSLLGPAHLYDVGGHQYLGHTDNTPVAVSPTAGQLIAALPYEIAGLNISTTKRVKQGGGVGITAQLQTRPGPAGDHVLRMEVTRPDGSPCPYWTKNIVAEHGSYRTTLSVALNEMVGKWRIRLLDVLSGKTAEAAFEVGSR